MTADELKALAKALKQVNDWRLPENVFVHEVVVSTSVDDDIRVSLVWDDYATEFVLGVSE